MMLFSVKIEGVSCWPYLIPGKKYFATNVLKPKIGNFIVFKNPKNQKEIFVKKVKTIQGNSYFVEGTVAFATSSKDFGQVHKNLILGKILFSFA